MAIFDTRTPINYCGLVNEFFATRATNQNIGVVAYERLKNAFKQFVSEKLQSAMETDMTWHETVFETHNGQLYAVTYAEYLGDSSRYSDRCLFKTNNENSGGSTGNPGTATSSTGSRTANCCCYQNNIPVMYPMDKIEWRNEYYFPDVPCTHKPEGTYQRMYLNGKRTDNLRNHTSNFRVTERGDFENRFTTYETRIFSKKRTCTVTTRYQIKFIEYWVNGVKLCEIKQDVGVVSVTDSCRTNSSGSSYSGDSDAHSGGQRYGDVDGVLTDLETGEPVFGGNDSGSSGGGGSGAGSDAGGNDYGDPGNW